MIITSAQLLAHLLGDYFLQSGWMANNKTKRCWPAFVHAVVYSLPFLLMFQPSLEAMFVIMSTHFLIDRWRLARYVAYAKEFLSPYSTWRPWSEHSGTGYHKDTPPFLSVWLMILIDNTMHIMINAVALTCF
ncbi:MAG: DUF3307 domain-containing protein [Candidatus Sungbacteria bacterium]|nr:DUF3307 domain-containing protein [Candidatus Sungbacteria bacterium]